MDSKKVFFSAEACEFVTENVSNQVVVKVKGTAIPFNRMSRNGVRYRDESVKRAQPSMERVSFLFNHNTDVVLGHVEASGLSEDGVTYVADIDPTEEKFIKKIERGDIRHVSIGAMVSNPEFHEDGTVTVDIDEFVELSLVPVPGFKDASVSRQGALLVAEAFGEDDLVKKLKEGVVMKEKNDNDKDASVSVEEKLEKVEVLVKEFVGSLEEMSNRLAIIESRMDSFEEKEGAEGDSPEGSAPEGDNGGDVAGDSKVDDSSEGGSESSEKCDKSDEDKHKDDEEEKDKDKDDEEEKDKDKDDEEEDDDEDEEEKSKRQGMKLPEKEENYKISLNELRLKNKAY